MAEPPFATISNATVPETPGTVALLLLAAGASTRMGQPKQLLAYRGRTLLRHAAETAAASGCRPLVLVTGAIHAALAAEVAGLPFQIAHNTTWQTGMASSIQAGLAAVADAQPAALLIMLSDQPFVTSKLLRQLVAQQQQSHAPIAATAYGDVLGVPAVFDCSMFAALGQLQGGQGANRLIASLGQAVGRVPFPEGILDVDTPEQYAQLLRSCLS